MTTLEPPTRWSAPWWLLAALIAFGALLRWVAVQHQQAIAVDSVRYLTFADNWLAGQYYTLGPTGLREFPDLGYPLLITLLRPAAESTIRAGQWVSFLAGVALLIPLYRIARLLYGSLVGFYTLFLAAIAQPLIVASGQVQTESLFLLWSLLALDAALTVLRAPAPSGGLLLGFACAMGYLTRGVGVLLFPLALALLVWGWRQPGLFLAARVSGEDEPPSPADLPREVLPVGPVPALVAAVLMWLVPVVAYQVMLSATYGGFTLSDQAIWHVGGLTGSLDAQTEDIRLEGTLSADGTEYALNEWSAAGRPRTGAIDLGALAVRYAKNVVGILEYIPEELFSPVTIVLIALGLFGAAGAPRVPRAALMLAWWMAPYLLVQPLMLTLARYLLPCVPLGLVFAARGVVSLQEWAIGRWLHGHPKATLADLAFQERLLFLALFCLYLPGMVWPVTHVAPRYQNLELAKAGHWMANQRLEGGLFASTQVAGFYASMSPNLVLPNAELTAILRLAERKNVRYLLLDERRVDPLYSDELNTLLTCAPEQLPKSLTLLHEIEEFSGYKVRIFQIVRAGLADAPLQ